MATNEILRFAQTDTTTNLLTQAEYDADAQRLIGNQPGVARSKLVNKALRQSSLISAGVAQFIAEYQSNNVTDGLTPANISDYLEAAIQAMPVAAGTAAAPSIAPTGDTNTGLYFPAADTVAIATGGVKRVEVDASGNVGIGYESVSLPPNTTYRGVFMNDGPCLLNYLGNGFLGFNTYTTGVGQVKYIKNYGATAYTFDQSGYHKWYTAPAGTAGSTIPFGDPKMTLDSSGNLLLATTSGYSARMSFAWDSSGQSGIILRATSATFSGNPMVFQDSGGVARGSISQTASAVAYNTSSDYRLKEDIQPMTGALAKVAALNPVTYTWKGTGEDSQGFIAHELQAVVPDCVTGEKDAVDEDGNPVYQGIDTSFLVATLTAAIQEQQALIEKQQSLIESLTDRIAALEAK